MECLHEGCPDHDTFFDDNCGRNGMKACMEDKPQAQNPPVPQVCSKDLLARAVCHFINNDEDDEWYTDCGDAFNFNGGNPQDARMNFCPNCGGKVSC